MLARNVTAKIVLNGKDITRDVSPYLRSISYEDNLSGEADTVSVDLMDKARLFIGDWFAPLGATLNIELIKQNFRGGGATERLGLGEFEVDEITNSYPPSVCKIKAVSISQNSYLRQHNYSKSFENVRLSEIAQEIANAAGLQLFFKAADDPLISRAEYGEQSTLAFLEKICADYGLAVKVADNLLIIFDETDLEANDAVTTFDRNNSTILNFDARATLNEIYGSCEVSYKNSKQAELYKATFDAPNKTSDKVLRVNQKVENQAEAEKLAKKKLRQKNKDAIKINLTVVGSFELLAGNCVELKSHGFYDGKYIIEKSTHNVSDDGYTVRFELRKCLQGY